MSKTNKVGKKEVLGLLTEILERLDKVEERLDALEAKDKGDYIETFGPATGLSREEEDIL